MTVRIIKGDVREKLAEFPADYFDCIVTSPPYFGLRDYGTATWEGGDPDCDHEPDKEWYINFNAKSKLNGAETKHPSSQTACAKGRWYGGDGSCPRCGARRIDAQIGLEPTIDAYIETIVAVCHELRRVLKPSGVFFLNIGDSYNSAPAGNKTPTGLSQLRPKRAAADLSEYNPTRKITGLKPKDLCLVPERLGIALQADGWWVRSKICWHKLNPIPESCTDRPASAHEVIWMLTKSERYYYDNIAVAEYTNSHENMHKMSRRNGRKSFPEGEERKERTIVAVPELSLGEDRCISPDAKRQTANASVSGSLQCHGETQGETGRVQQIGKEKDIECGVAENTKWNSFFSSVHEIGQEKGGQKEALRKRQGENIERSLSSYHEGQSMLGARGSQTPWSDEDSQHSDVIGVGNDQNTCKSQMSLLSQNDELPDYGSCNPNKQRRGAHSFEHCSSVPELQCSEREPNNVPDLRNLRNVWSVASEPTPFSHFATMPTSIAERCIKAGSSERGCCPACGKPWVRVKICTHQGRDWHSDRMIDAGIVGELSGDGGYKRGRSHEPLNDTKQYESVGWKPSCNCTPIVPQLAPSRILDPFAGAGTTGLVADRLGRDCTLIDLNTEYAKMALNRIKDDCPMFTEVAAE